MLAAIALAASLDGAHWAKLDGPRFPVVVRKIVALGEGRDEHAILFFEDGTCRKVKTFTGAYGDEAKAWAFVRKEKFCEVQPKQKGKP